MDMYLFRRCKACVVSTHWKHSFHPSEAKLPPFGSRPSTHWKENKCLIATLPLPFTLITPSLCSGEFAIRPHRASGFIIRKTISALQMLILKGVRIANSHERRKRGTHPQVNPSSLFFILPSYPPPYGGIY